MAPCLSCRVGEARGLDPAEAARPLDQASVALGLALAWLRRQGLGHHRGPVPPPFWPSPRFLFSFPCMGVFSKDPTYLDQTRLLPWRPPINFVGK